MRERFTTPKIDVSAVQQIKCRPDATLHGHQRCSSKLLIVLEAHTHSPQTAASPTALGYHVAPESCCIATWFATTSNRIESPTWFMQNITPMRLPESTTPPVGFQMKTDSGLSRQAASSGSRLARACLQRTCVYPRLAQPGASGNENVSHQRYPLVQKASSSERKSGGDR